MNIVSKKILLTGSHGTLGNQIIKSKLFDDLVTPSKQVLDITQPVSIDEYLLDNDIDSVIHCAALARMAACQENPEKAILVNVVGTSYLVRSIIEFEKRKNKKIRFIYISTDGVYSSEKGDYSEKSATIPYNNYGWSKLGAECAVNMLSDYVIIRTRFFNPDNIPFEDSADDIYTSSIPLNKLVEAIHLLVNSNYIGTINVGDVRMSEFDRYRKYKPLIKSCKRDNITKHLHFEIAKDASMDCDLWHKLKKQLQ